MNEIARHSIKDLTKSTEKHFECEERLLAYSCTLLRLASVPATSLKIHKLTPDSGVNPQQEAKSEKDRPKQGRPASHHAAKMPMIMECYLSVFDSPLVVLPPVGQGFSCRLNCSHRRQETCRYMDRLAITILSQTGFRTC
jgi:hypothetical protein